MSDLTMEKLRELSSKAEQGVIEEVEESNEAPAAEPTKEEAAPAPEETPEETVEGEAEQSEELPAFSFERKFKAKDPDGNSKEFEIPEYLTKAVANEEQAKEVKELFEKAYGLDFMKNRFQDSRTKYQNLEQNYQILNTNISEAKKHFQRGDYDSLFQSLGIPEQNVLQWVVNKLEYNQLPPEEQRIRDMQMQQTKQMYERESNLERQQQYAQDLVVQAKATELAAALSKPEVSNFAEAFDQRLGRPGAFRDEAITRAEIAWFTRKQEISADQAVQEVLQMYGGTTPQLNNSMAHQGQIQQSVRAPSQAPPETKVIPRIKSGSSSPTQALPSSIDDLKKIYNQKFRS